MATQAVVQQDLPNGPVAAVLVAGGIGAAALGIVTTLAEASEALKNALNWYDPVGPLTGKSIVGVIVFLVAWGALHVMYRGKDVNFTRATAVALALLGIALLTTFPPVFELFASG